MMSFLRFLWAYPGLREKVLAALTIIASAIAAYIGLT